MYFNHRLLLFNLMWYFIINFCTFFILFVLVAFIERSYSCAKHIHILYNYTSGGRWIFARRNRLKGILIYLKSYYKKQLSVVQKKGLKNVPLKRIEIFMPYDIVKYLSLYFLNRNQKVINHFYYTYSINSRLLK